MYQNVISLMRGSLLRPCTVDRISSPQQTFFGPEFVQVAEDPNLSVVNISPVCKLYKHKNIEIGNSTCGSNCVVIFFRKYPCCVAAVVVVAFVHAI